MDKRYLVPAVLAAAFAIYIFAVGSTGRFIFYGLPILLGIAGAVVLGRNAPQRTYRGHLFTGLRLYFAFHLIWTCLRYWFTDTQPVIPDPVGADFVASLEAMGMFPVIKTLEGVVGVLLLVNRFVPLALVAELPVSVSIFWLNALIVADSHTLVSGPAELLVNALLLLAYLPHYRGMLLARSEPFTQNWPAPVAQDGDVPNRR